MEHEWSSALSFKQVIAGSLPVHDASFGSVAKTGKHPALNREMREFDSPRTHQYWQVADNGKALDC